MYHQKQLTANFISQRLSMHSSDIASVTTDSKKILQIPEEVHKSSVNSKDYPKTDGYPEHNEEKERLMAEYKNLKKQLD